MLRTHRHRTDAPVATPALRSVDTRQRTYACTACTPRMQLSHRGGPSLRLDTAASGLRPRWALGSAGAEILGPRRSRVRTRSEPCWAGLSILLDRCLRAAPLLPRLDAVSQAGPSVLIVQRCETHVPPEFAQQSQRPVLSPLPRRRPISGMLGDAEFENGKIQTPHRFGDHPTHRSTVGWSKRMPVQRLSPQVGEGVELTLDVAGAVVEPAGDAVEQLPHPPVRRNVFRGDSDLSPGPARCATCRRCRASGRSGSGAGTHRAGRHPWPRRCSDRRPPRRAAGAGARRSDRQPGGGSSCRTASRTGEGCRYRPAPPDPPPVTAAARVRACTLRVRPTGYGSLRAGACDG